MTKVQKNSKNAQGASRNFDSILGPTWHSKSHLCSQAGQKYFRMSLRTSPESHFPAGKLIFVQGNVGIPANQHFCILMAPKCSNRSQLGSQFGPTWPQLSASWPHLGPLWLLLGLVLVHFGPNLSDLGANLASSWPIGVSTWPRNLARGPSQAPRTAPRPP